MSISLVATRDALKAQNATLEAERDNLRMLLAGSDYARVVEELERLRIIGQSLIAKDATIVTLTTELERLRDLIVAWSGGRDVALKALADEANAIYARAAREAGKA